MKDSCEFDTDEIMVIYFNKDGWIGYFGEKKKMRKKNEFL